MDRKFSFVSLLHQDRSPQTESVSSFACLLRALPLCFVLLLLLPGETGAQDLRFGVKSGLNFSTFRGDTNVITDNLNSSGLRRRVSFHVGGFALVEVSRRFLFQPELLYVQKGAVLEGSTFGTPDLTGTYRFAYLQLPLLLKYRIPTKGIVTPVLLGGPSGAINTASGLQVDSRGSAQRGSFDTETLSFDNVTNTFSIGGILGGGLHFHLNGSQMITFNVHYNPGLSDITSEEGVELRTDTITFSVGYVL